MAACLLLAACQRADPPQTSAAPAAAGAIADTTILVRGNGPEPDSLDPQRARNVESGNVLRDMYEGLTSVGHDGAPVPGVAREWSVSADGLTWTFRLRPEARWSNGDPVVAEDFVAALRRLVDPATASQYAQVVDAIRNAPEIITGRRPPAELGVAASDEHTLVITLANPTPYLPGLFSHWSTLPLHRPSFAQWGTEFVKPGRHVSNGAFRLARWVQGAEIELERNRAYWNDAATKLARVRWISQSDENAEYKRWRAGELHVSYTVPRGQFDGIRRDHAAELHIGPQLGTYFFGFNLDREPFRSQPGLRRALSMAIDRQRLVQSVTRVGELAAEGWVPPGTFDYTSQRFDYADWPMERRIAEARRLYAAAGYSTAKPLRFELRYNSGELHNRIAVAIAAMWKQALGVEAQLVAEEFKVLQQNIDARRVDVYRLAWIGDYNDAYTFAQYFKSDFGINTAHYRSARYDELLLAAARETDGAKRRASLEQAERVLLADQPLIPIYFYVNKHLVNPQVRGWYDNVMNVVYSRELELAPAGAQGKGAGP
ncbi:MAG: peptide ABC transporter substrate-binding protein [Steroidobacteraceae bacterium]